MANEASTSWHPDQCGIVETTSEPGKLAAGIRATKQAIDIKRLIGRSGALEKRSWKSRTNLPNFE